MIKIGILGYGGRMGQLIAKEIAVHPDCSLAGGVVRNPKADLPKPEGAVITANAEDVIKFSDVVIDVTLADATPGYAKLAAQHNKAFVCCTTGFGADVMDALKQASGKIPLLYASNTSLSMAAVRQITELASKLLGNLPYDISILDEHHAMKKDAPSGAAKLLGEAVVKGSQGKKTPSYASVRAGHIVGEHEVVFATEGEIIRIRSSVTDRRIFARGALQAALWLAGKPKGFYGMADVLGI